MVAVFGLEDGLFVMMIPTFLCFGLDLAFFECTMLCCWQLSIFHKGKIDRTSGMRCNAFQKYCDGLHNVQNISFLCTYRRRTAEQSQLKYAKQCNCLSRAPKASDSQSYRVLMELACFARRQKSSGRLSAISSLTLHLLEKTSQISNSQYKNDLNQSKLTFACSGQFLTLVIGFDFLCKGQYNLNQVSIKHELTVGK